MARQVYRFEDPERFVAGTVGEPGARTFFLQARRGNAVTSVACEKEQVTVLADRLDALLDEVLRRSGGTAPVPAMPPAEQEDLGPLDQPIVEEFRVGTMTLAWDEDAGSVVVEAFAAAGDDDAEEPVELDDETAAQVAAAVEDPDSDVPAEELVAIAAATADRDVLVVRLTGSQARSFAKRSRAVVGAGRPPCPLCQQPLDPQGHICPRQNGFRRRV